MDDDRLWRFEESLWTADQERYREAVDPDCLMALPHPPYVLGGEAALAAVVNTPRWTAVTLDQRHVTRPQEGWIVIAYRVRASRPDAAPYEAACTSTYRRHGPGDWSVVQHSQTPPLSVGSPVGD